jgi:hypothetical protein
MSDEPQEQDGNEDAKPDIRVIVDSEGKVKSVALDLDVIEYIVVGLVLIAITYFIGSWGLF